jgi:hypothetical protein
MNNQEALFDPDAFFEQYRDYTPQQQGITTNRYLNSQPRILGISKDTRGDVKVPHGRNLYDIAAVESGSGKNVALTRLTNLVS